jgi:hypothetical protein
MRYSDMPYLLFILLTTPRSLWLSLREQGMHPSKFWTAYMMVLEHKQWTSELDIFTPKSEAMLDNIRTLS